MPPYSFSVRLAFSDTIGGVGYCYVLFFLGLYDIFSFIHK